MNYFIQCIIKPLFYIMITKQLCSHAITPYFVSVRFNFMDRTASACVFIGVRFHFIERTASACVFIGVRFHFINRTASACVFKFHGSVVDIFMYVHCRLLYAVPPAVCTAACCMHCRLLYALPPAVCTAA